MGPPHVFGMGHGLQVVRVDASAIATEMVEFAIDRHWSDEQFPCVPVRVGRFARAKAELTVAQLAAACRPFPAIAVRVNLLPESLLDGA